MRKSVGSRASSAACNRTTTRDPRVSFGRRAQRCAQRCARRGLTFHRDDFRCVPWERYHPFFARDRRLNAIAGAAPGRARLTGTGPSSSVLLIEAAVLARSAPPRPHAEFVGRRTHVPFWQQPTKQLRAEHVRGRPELGRPGAAAGGSRGATGAGGPGRFHRPRQVPLWHRPPAVVQFHAGREPAADREAALLVPGEQPRSSDHTATRGDAARATRRVIPCVARVVACRGVLHVICRRCLAVGPPLLLVLEPPPDDEGPPPPASRGAVVAGPPASSSPAIRTGDEALGLLGARGADDQADRPPTATQMPRARVGASFPSWRRAFPFATGVLVPMTARRSRSFGLGGDKSARQSGASYSVLRRSSALQNAGTPAAGRVAGALAV